MKSVIVIVALLLGFHTICCAKKHDQKHKLCLKRQSDNGAISFSATILDTTLKSDGYGCITLSSSAFKKYNGEEIKILINRNTASGCDTNKFLLVADSKTLTTTSNLINPHNEVLLVDRLLKHYDNVLYALAEPKQGSHEVSNADDKPYKLIITPPKATSRSYKIYVGDTTFTSDANGVLALSKDDFVKYGKKTIHFDLKSKIKDDFLFFRSHKNNPTYRVTFSKVFDNGEIYAADLIARPQSEVISEINSSPELKST